jgi:hypothetical protein
MLTFCVTKHKKYNPVNTRTTAMCNLVSSSARTLADALTPLETVCLDKMYCEIPSRTEQGNLVPLC